MVAFSQKREQKKKRGEEASEKRRDQLLERFIEKITDPIKTLLEKFMLEERKLYLEQVNSSSLTFEVEKLVDRLGL